ncbi:MAG: FMN-bind domain-containing protein [Burkholderia sp.]|jgi:urocanate reductase
MKISRTFIALAVAGALGSAYAAPSFKAGTYTAEANGIHGPVAVEVTFSASRIESVKVTKQNETVGIGSRAVELLPSKIVEAQSPAVDGVSGATVTSTAIRTAVADCVKQAGVDPATLVPLASKKAAKNEELTTDVVIVGGGGAGMSATIRTRMNGLNALLIEKMPFIGGAASISGGQVVAQGSKLQKEYGSRDDSPESMIKDFQANGHNLNDLSKLTLYANNVGATIDWLHDEVGVKFVPNDLPYLAEYSHPRALESQGGAKTMAQHLREVIASDGAKVLYNTRVKELIVEDGKVVGVKAEDTVNGINYTVRAKKTLLSTGGYGNNKDMLSGDLKTALYYGPVSSTGDGLRMAQKLGAKTQLLQYGKRYPNGIEVAPGIAKSTIYANVGAFDVAGILVDVNGKRFVNEKASNRHILDPMLQTPNKQAYVFMDEASWKGFYKRLPETGVSHEDADKYLANNGKSEPLFVKGATIEEAAKLAGIDPAGLKATVARYNGFVKAKKDADFGRPAQFMNAEISATGPYYIVEQKPRFATTMGGVVTDDNLNIVGQDGKVIPNLYAAGELVGGVMGDDSPAGANVGWALTSGRVAADRMAEAIKAGK